jgi:hypothetical protein
MAPGTYDGLKGPVVGKIETSQHPRVSAILSNTRIVELTDNDGRISVPVVTVNDGRIRSHGKIGVLKRPEKLRADGGESRRLSQDTLRGSLGDPRRCLSYWC